MKTTMYKCDRCGAALGCDGEALEKNRWMPLPELPKE